MAKFEAHITCPREHAELVRQHGGLTGPGVPARRLLGPPDQEPVMGCSPDYGPEYYEARRKQGVAMRLLHKLADLPSSRFTVGELQFMATDFYKGFRHGPHDGDIERIHALAAREGVALEW